MRVLMLAPLALLAACSEAEAPKAEAAASALDAGQWELVSEITEFTKADSGAPRMKGAVGTKATTSACVTTETAKKPDPALFAGEGETCTYDNAYMSNGRLNLGLLCKKAGVSGEVRRSISGTFTKTGFDATGSADTFFTSDGDVRLAYKLTGAHKGACTAAGKTS